MSQDKFSSKVPEHLLEGETPAMKYLITELSKNTQATEFLLQKREESGVVLDEISSKLDYTNGAIAEAKREIFDLQTKAKKHEEISEDLSQIVKIKKILEKLFTSKIFWVSTTVVLILLAKSGFFLLLFNWLSNHLGV